MMEATWAALGVLLFLVCSVPCSGAPIAPNTLGRLLELTSFSNGEINQFLPYEIQDVALSDVIDSSLAYFLFNGQERTFSVPGFTLLGDQLQFSNGSVSLVCSPSETCEAELTGIITLGSAVTLSMSLEMFSNGTWNGVATLAGGPFAFGDIIAVQTFTNTQLPPWLQSTTFPLTSWEIADLQIFLTREQDDISTSANSLYLATAHVELELDNWNIIPGILSIHDVYIEVDYVNPRSPTATNTTQEISGAIKGDANLGGLEASVDASFPVGPTEIVLFYNQTLDFGIFSISKVRLVLKPQHGGMGELNWTLSAEWMIGPDGEESEFDVFITQVEETSAFKVEVTQKEDDINPLTVNTIFGSFIPGLKIPVLGNFGLDDAHFVAQFGALDDSSPDPRYPTYLIEGKPTFTEEAKIQVIIGKTDPPESKVAVAVIMCTLPGFKLSHIHTGLHKLDSIPVGNLSFGYVSKEFDFEPYEACSNKVQFINSLKLPNFTSILGGRRRRQAIGGENVEDQLDGKHGLLEKLDTLAKKYKFKPGTLLGTIKSPTGSVRDLLANVLSQDADEIGANLPTFIGDLLDLSLDKLQISFVNTGPCAESFASFTLKNCVSAIIVQFSLPQWTLIPNKLAVEKIDVDLLIKQPFDPSSRTTSGHVSGSVVLGSGVSKVVMKAHIPIPVSGKKIVIDASNFAIPTVLDNLIDIFIPSSWNVPSLPGTSTFLDNLFIDRVVIEFDENNNVDGIVVTVSIPTSGKIAGLLELTNAEAIISVSEISSDDEAVWKLEVKGEWEIMIGTTCEASLAFQDPDFILTLGCDSITLQQLTNAIVPVPVTLPSKIQGFTVYEPAASASIGTDGDFLLGFSGEPGGIGLSIKIMIGHEAGSWKFAAGAFYGPATSPADVDNALAFLDSKPVSSLALIYSTDEFVITPFDWTGISELPAGLQLLAVMNAEDLDGFIGNWMESLEIEFLFVRGIIPPDFSSLVLQAGIEGNIPLGSRAWLQSMYLEIKVTPPTVTLQGTVKVIVKDDTLFLTGGIGVGVAGFKFFFRMTGTWNNPLGLKNVAISNVAMELGLTPAGIPFAIGFGGTLHLKDLVGSTDVYYNVERPWEILLSFSINRLTIGDIIGLFLKRLSLPKEIADCGFPEGIEAYFCTGNVNFAGKNYPPGLYFKGTFAIPFLGIRAEAEVQVDTPRLFYARLYLEKIDWGFLKIQRSFSGSGASIGPILLIDIRPFEGKFLVYAEAAIKLLGISAHARLEITTSGLSFSVTGNLWNVFEAHLEIEAGWPSKKQVSAGDPCETNKPTSKHQSPSLDSNPIHTPRPTITSHLPRNPKITIKTLDWQNQLKSVLVSDKVCHNVKHTTFAQISYISRRLTLDPSITVPSLRFRQPNKKVYVNSGIYDTGKFESAILSPVNSLSARFRRSLLLRRRRQLPRLRFNPVLPLPQSDRLSPAFRPGNPIPPSNCGGERYSGGAPASGQPKFRVSGYFKNDLFTKIRESASKLIDDAVNFITNGLKKAQDAVKKAKDAVGKLDINVANHKREIQEWKTACKTAKRLKKIKICAQAAVKIVWHGVAIGIIQVARGVALAALSAAELILQGLEAAIQVTGNILQAIINGVFGAIDIKRGEFEFELSSNVKRFYVEFEIDFFEWTLTPRLEINFNSIWDAVKSVGRSIGNIIKPLLVEV